MLPTRLASALHDVGAHYREMGRRQEALGPTEEAVRIQGRWPEVRAPRARSCGVHQHNLADPYRELGREEDAVIARAKAERIQAAQGRKTSSRRKTYLIDAALVLAALMLWLLR